MPMYSHTLEFGQENRIFLATRSVLWPKTCRKCDRGRGYAPDRTGELTTLPHTRSRLGRKHPSPYPTPLGAFGASMLAPSAPRSSCPPDTKAWRRHWSPPLFTAPCYSNGAVMPSYDVCPSVRPWRWWMLITYVELGGILLHG